jgi:peptidoglycan/LPS O-acetylase OafA/YrhL
MTTSELPTSVETPTEPSAQAPDETGSDTSAPPELASDAAVTATVASNASTRRGRLEFLDVLRGVAALMVVLQHCLEVLSPRYLRWSVEVFRPGEFGVVLFFLVSGFIIPASMERYRSLRKFWIGRVFRLFPLYWAATAAAVLIYVLLHRYPLSTGFLNRPRFSALINATMVQDFLHVDAVIGASWSLSYELVFYLLVSLLFVAGLNTRSVQLSVGVTSSIVLVGLFLPAGIIATSMSDPSLSAAMHDKPLLFVAMAALATIWFSISRARKPAHRGAAVGLVLLAFPLLFNQPRDLWFSLLLFAMMVAGTVFFRMASGTVSARTGGVTVAFTVVTMALTFHTWVAPHIGLAGAHITAWPEILTFGGAAAVFAVAYLARSLRYPRFLTWLGAVSYSVYLVHGLILNLVPQITGSVLGIPGAALSLVLWVGLTVAVSAMTYRYIEMPFQRLGHKLVKRLGAPNAATALPAPVAVTGAP